MKSEADVWELDEVLGGTYTQNDQQAKPRKLGHQQLRTSNPSGWISEHFVACNSDYP